jgi:predicted DNA-binding transcriptional regulator AlpA
MKRQRALPPNLEPLAVSRPEAADLIGVSAPTWDALVKAEHMPAGIRIGARVLWDVAAVKRAWRALCDQQTRAQRRAA